MIEEEIKERIAAGNKIFIVNKKMLCKLLTRRSPFYRSLIRPVVTYGREAWVLKNTRMTIKSV